MLLSLVRCIFKACAGYLLVAVACLVFVVSNDCVVVGDRSAHQVVLHPTQVLYFSAFCLCFSAPYAISRIEPFFEKCKKHWIVLLGFVLFVISVIKSYTLAHPYLLADNRHYTFYIWRKIITRTSLTPILMTPIYIYGAFSVLYSLRRTELAFKIAFPLCVVINLFPQYLLEL